MTSDDAIAGFSVDRCGLIQCSGFGIGSFAAVVFDLALTLLVQGCSMVPAWP